MQTDLECLLFLENSTVSIMEIKYQGQIKWLQVNNASMQVTPLSEQSADSSREVQERFFDLGYLKFNTQSGIFIEKYNSAQHSLSLRGESDVPVPYLIAIDEFLNGRLQLCS